MKPKLSSKKLRFAVGEKVKIVKIPESLVRDLPEDEIQEMRRCEGRVFKIEKIDANGLLWFGFGHSKNLKDRTHYSGHSFCLEPKYVVPTRR